MPPIRKISAGYIRPDILFTNVKGLKLRDNDEITLDFVSEKLNEQLRSEIQKAVGKISKPMMEAINLMITNLDYETLQNTDVSIIVSNILNEIKKANRNDGNDLAVEASKIEKNLFDKPSKKVSELLYLDVPLKDNPIFIKDLMIAKNFEYAKLAKLDDEAAKMLIEKTPSFDGSVEITLTNLVKQGSINEEQKQDLLLVFDLAKLTGDNLPFIKSLKTDRFRSMIELVRMSEFDWQRLILNERIPLPPGETAKGYAENMMFNIEKAYPSEFLISRINLQNGIDRLNPLDMLNNLLRTNDKLIVAGRQANYHVDLVDWTGIADESIEKLKKDLGDITAFANTYRHLGVIDIINNKDIDVVQKKSRISSRFQLLHTFYKNNPTLDLRFANLIDKEKSRSLNWNEIPADDQRLVKRQLMAYQRILELAEDPNDGIALMANGYDSALSISDRTEDEFIKTSGLEIGRAKVTYAKAIKHSTATAAYYQTAHDMQHGNFKDTAVSNQEPKLINDLRNIDGLEELFGSQNFCACEECKSIFSPAAYFVDLMYFIQENISKPSLLFDTLQPLYLKIRRGDLWTLRLTCENTHTLVPYLNIVNEILESYLQRVYHWNDVYSELGKGTQNISFNLPFNLPLEELRIYLKHFGTSLFEIYATLNQPDEKIWRARINLSNEEYVDIVTEDIPNVRKRFGDKSSLVNFPILDFMRYAGINREQLTDLLDIQFKIIPDLSSIGIKKMPDPSGDELVNFLEVLTGLTVEQLDPIHRFIKLWKKTPWTIKELDLVLTSLNQAGLINTNLDEKVVLHLAQLVEIQETLKLTVEELCPLFHLMPVSEEFPSPPAKLSERKLLERLFDVKKIFGESYPASFYHYSFNSDTDDKTIDSKTPILLAGLGISETELLMLLDLLKDEIPIGGDGYWTLDLRSISLLYRHARIAKALRFQIEDFIQALYLNFDPSSYVITSFQQIYQLREFRDWLKASPFKVSELRFILKGEESSKVKFKSDLDSVSTVVQEIQMSQRMNLDNDARRQIVETLVKKIQASQWINKVDALKDSLSKDNGLTTDQVMHTLEWLKIDINSPGIHSSLNTHFTDGQPDNPLDLNPLIDLIRQLDFALPLFQSLSKFFNLTFDQLTDTMQWVHYNIAGVEASLNTHFTDGQPDNPLDLNPLIDLLRGIERVLLLLSTNLKLNQVVVAHITSMPQDFGITELKELTLANLRNLTFYKKLLSFNEVEPSLFVVLDNYPSSNNVAFSNESIAFLADFWKQEQSLIKSIANSAELPVVPIEAVEFLWKYLNMCRTLGIDGYTLQLLGLDTTYEELDRARDVILGAFSSKYDDEKIRIEKLEPYKDMINTKKRDALCDYIIAKEKTLKFKDLDDLYAFFLLDVEMGGCARTSRLVCAISSLQLYVHRCLINLEQSQSAPNIKVDPICVPREQWEWRKNYRVWEANRKVFVYPENYCEPDLRDNKTPIFKELEDELLQKRITKESAEASYKQYVSKFAELARLDIAGSYYEANTKTYYFFGRSSQNPPQYYIRKWISWSVWTPWEKMELAINAKRVSATRHFGRLFIFWSEFRKTTQTTFDGGNSVQSIAAYRDLLYSYLNEQGRWIPPQKFLWTGGTLQNYDEVEWEKFTNYYSIPIFPSKPNGPKITFHGFNLTHDNRQGMQIDLFKNELTEYSGTEEIIPAKIRVLRIHSTGRLQKVSTTYHIHEAKLQFEAEDRDEYWNEGDFYGSVFVTSNLPESRLHLVGNKPGDSVLKVDDQQYLMAWNGFRLKWTAYRLGTSIIEELAEILLGSGIEVFLSYNTQRDFIEHPIGVSFESMLRGPFDDPKHIDFTGACGDYYRELFFHIPFLIAHNCNANTKFEDSKWWYERIFNPTASETPGDPPTDRNWQYIEFRGLTIQKMIDILTEPSALEQYENNPFNPHAIARLRMTAYQKTIVMKYIDNLLDWGDHLFAQDTMESINEATMLYILAADILGKRPAELGKCEPTVNEENLTYEKIGPQLSEENQVLIAFENLSYTFAIKSTIDNNVLNATHDLVDYDTSAELKEVGDKQYKDAKKSPGKNLSPAVPQVRQSMLVFCIPPNYDLLRYWDRVQDRLFKIRNCMNISGIRRQLDLFQPPIDPMLLVRAKAAGLSLEDVLRGLAKSLPPYRFNYLIEKAKQFAQTVQSFGSALLNALEKKDVEELTLLRSVHEREILGLTREIKIQQVQEAEHQLQSLEEAKINVQNKIDYYDRLDKSPLNAPEIRQQENQDEAIFLKGYEKLSRLLSAGIYLIPQQGSPVALTYGGKQVGDSASAISSVFSVQASIQDSRAAADGLEGSHLKREDDVRQQLKVNRQELIQVEQQRLAAEIRVAISEKELEIHDRNIEHAEILDNFYKNKFTNLGLYNYLSITLNRLYRESYNMAHDMAKTAEQTYQFERDDNTLFIAGDNWQFDRAGLLAGERLLLQLQRMEKAYLEQNQREYEITQSFSLALLDPSNLLKLQQTGSCDLIIPGAAYDIFYPGQYRRIIKSVRVTIPCIAGPYTNVSAKLTLKKSEVLKDPLDEELTEIPKQKLTSIATSTAQNDGGVFELNFRDERYLPFEGAGAISIWGIELPSVIRLFDYNTISDFIMHISYTAKDDAALKAKIEQNILDDLSGGKTLYRLISLKHEFPSALHQLLNFTGQIQTTEFEIEKKHFPFFLRYRIPSISSVIVYLKPKGKDPVEIESPIIEIRNKPIENWKIMASTNLREGSVSITGNALGKWTVSAGDDSLDKEQVDDILILLGYTLDEE